MNKVGVARSVFDVIFPLIAEKKWDDLKEVFRELDPETLDAVEIIAYLRGSVPVRKALEPEYSDFLADVTDVFIRREMDYKNILKGLLGDMPGDRGPVFVPTKR